MTALDVLAEEFLTGEGQESRRHMGGSRLSAERVAFGQGGWFAVERPTPLIILVWAVHGLSPIRCVSTVHFPFHSYSLHLQKSRRLVSRAFSTQTRALPAATEAASLLIEVALQEPSPV